MDGDQSVDDIVWFEFFAPTTLGCYPFETCDPDFGDFQGNSRKL
jgi:hypothetical protein